MENSVRYLSSMHLNSPNLTGRPGALLDVLDGALVTGFNEVDVLSLTRVGAIATVVTAAPHGMGRGECCRLSGATDPLYNADFRIDAVISSTEFKITVDSNAASSETRLKCRIAPLGWLNPFRNGFVSVYRSANPTSSQAYYQFNDDMSTSIGGAEAGVRMYETMTAYNTGELPAPSMGAATLGRAIRKSSASDTIRRHWVIIGDTKSFYLFTDPETNASSASSAIGAESRLAPYFFGDFIPVSSADRYTASIFAGPITNMTWANFSSNPGASQISSGNFPTCFLQGDSAQSYLNASWYSTAAGDVQRDPSGVNTNAYAWTWGRPSAPGGFFSMGSGTLINYPNGSDGALLITPVVLVGNNNAGMRGRMPGAYDTYHGVICATLQNVENVLALPNRTLKAIRLRHGYQTGLALIDITGPWE